VQKERRFNRFIVDKDLRDLRVMDECALMLDGRLWQQSRFCRRPGINFHRYDSKYGKADHNARVFQHLLRLASCQARPSIW
jgi:hypothetical protein